MDYFIGFLMVAECLICALLILIVLMQRPRQEGLGAAFGGGMTDQMFGAHTTNVLQKGTTWLGIALFVLAFALAVLISHRDKSKDPGQLFDEAELKPAAAEVEKAAETPAPAPATVPDAAAPEAAPSAGDKPAAEKEKAADPAPAPTPAAPDAAPAPAAEAPAAPAQVPAAEAAKAEEKPEGALVPPPAAPAGN